MTEAKWMACADPTRMLEFLLGRAPERKLRLFACACCRTMGSSIPEGVFREAIGVAEDHADGRATHAELGAVVRALHRARRQRNALDRAVYDATRPRGYWGVERDVARAAAHAAAPNPSPSAVTRAAGGEAVTEEVPPDAGRLAWEAAYAAHLRLESSILRDLFGPTPFRAVPVREGVLTWNDGTVVRLAENAYNDRAFDRLAVLADALEEAGSGDTDILSHLRGPGPHVRGCWAIDLLLGKA